MQDLEKIEQMQKITTKLLQTSITKEIHRQAGDWDSSAQILENDLKKYGIKIPHKLYYEYKFPDDMKNFEYYNIVQPMYLFCQVYKEYFNDNYDDFNQYLIERIKDTQCDLSVFFRFCICLSLSDSKTNEQEFKKTYDNILKIKDKIGQKIKQLNPELQKVQYYKNFDFIMGAVYGFAPEEIEFFTKLQSIRKRKLNKYGEYAPVYNWEQSNTTLQQLLKQRITISYFLGHAPGYLLSPTTSNQIVAAIEQYLNNQQEIKYTQDRD